MRCLEINKIKFSYALYKGMEDIKDAEGKPTLSKKVVYDTPVEMYANISPSRGEADESTFGVNLDYDKVIVTEDMTCPIDENTVLCVDKPVSYSGERLEYDYVVKQVARSINSISYAIKKVSN